MPSSKKRGWGRVIYNWRVKSGKEVVFSNPSKFECASFIRNNKKNYKEKLRLIEPNY